MLEAIVKFRQALDEGKLQIGAGITLTDPLVTEALADSIDFAWYDLEHARMSPEALSAHLLAARYKGLPALVRVTDGITSNIKPALDAGVEGIIAPQVRTLAEVQAVVNDCRYPPLGQRGFGPRVPSNYGREAGDIHAEKANQRIFVCVMIETIEALEILDQIVAVPSLDSVVIGPSDLSWAMGLKGNYNHPEVVKAMETIIAKARKAGKYVGCGMGLDLEFARKMAERGAQWLQVGGDFNYLYDSADRVTREFIKLAASPA